MIKRENKTIIIGVFVALYLQLFIQFYETKIQVFEHQEKILSLQHEIEGDKRIIERLKRINELQKERIKILIKMHRVIECESGYRHDVYGDGGRAYGIGQWHKPTFQWLSKKAKLKLKYRDKNHQILLLKWAIENGYGNHWTCYRRCCI